jgi:hypothetical protein
MRLIKYRDAGMHTYTYFWVKEEGSGVLSPYFNTEKEAEDWLELQKYQAQAMGLWFKDGSCTGGKTE